MLTASRLRGLEEGTGGKGRGREGGERGGKGKEEREWKGKGERGGGSLYNWKPPPPGRNPGHATALPLLLVIT